MSRSNAPTTRFGGFGLKGTPVSVPGLPGEKEGTKPDNCNLKQVETAGNQSGRMFMSITDPMFLNNENTPTWSRPSRTGSQISPMPTSSPRPWPLKSKVHQWHLAHVAESYHNPRDPHACLVWLDLRRENCTRRPIRLQYEWTNGLMDREQ